MALAPVCCYRTPREFGASFRAGGGLWLRRLGCDFVKFFAGRFLERIGAVGHSVGGDLPEEDSAEPLLHGPLGLDRHRFGIVVADDDGVVG